MAVNCQIDDDKTTKRKYNFENEKDLNILKIS